MVKVTLIENRVVMHPEWSSSSVWHKINITESGGDRCLIMQKRGIKA
jgi:hypothetical protein